MPLYALWVSGEHIQKSAQAFVYGAWALFLVNTQAQLVNVALCKMSFQFALQVCVYHWRYGKYTLLYLLKFFLITFKSPGSFLNMILIHIKYLGSLTL